MDASKFFPKIKTEYYCLMFIQEQNKNFRHCNLLNCYSFVVLPRQTGSLFFPDKFLLELTRQ